MDLPDKSNPAPEKKKVEPVIPAATLAKRPASKRFFDYLFAESPKDAANKVLKDILLPRSKWLLQDALHGLVDGALGDNGGNRPITSVIAGNVLRSGGVNYNAISSGGVNPSAAAMMANTARPAGAYQDLVMPTQQHAELLLAGLYDLYNQYRVVTVADLYELASMTPQSAHGKYGWMSLEGARISKVREGFRLELPRPIIIP